MVIRLPTTRLRTGSVTAAKAAATTAARAPAQALAAMSRCRTDTAGWFSAALISANAGKARRATDGAAPCCSAPAHRAGTSVAAARGTAGRNRPGGQKAAAPAEGAPAPGRWPRPALLRAPGPRPALRGGARRAASAPLGRCRHRALGAVAHRTRLYLGYHALGCKTKRPRSTQGKSFQ
ncbi:unnamed protein product [Prorocentrum cordatum]|uniref:Uncharacterized protein n=1 Tax=Prorocentrum cordatum TaxID=2364126 RepID=A0ABN9PQ21_9DINO|nr:unnamed protein product [Polarella glacialis]